MQCLHSIFVQKSNTSIYDVIGKYLDEGFVVVYGVSVEDPAMPKGKFADRVYSRLTESAVIADLENHIENGQLRIIDIRETCFETNSFQPSKFLEKWSDMFKTMRKSKGFKGLVVISDGVNSFPDAGSQNNLVAYEQTVLKVITELGSIQVICCYLPEALKRFEFTTLMSLAAAHQCAVAGKLDHREISDIVILEAMYLGVEKVLGAGSAKLVFQTMKMIYRLDEKAIISNPNVFEEKLRKVLGQVSESVLKSVSEQVRLLL
jgi:hypothetical protein